MWSLQLHADMAMCANYSVGAWYSLVDPGGRGEGGASGNPHSHFTLMPDVGGCGFPQMKVPLAWMYITSAH